jgi:Domain of unknown function (DUF1902)
MYARQDVFTSSAESAIIRMSVHARERMMTKIEETTVKHISIKTVRHSTTGLLVASSDELPGLSVHGRSQDELDERMPVAIRALLEAMGQEVVSLEPVASKAIAPAGFVQLARDFDARVRHA